jgi:hypothetical protein
LPHGEGGHQRAVPSGRAEHGRLTTGAGGGADQEQDDDRSDKAALPVLRERAGYPR